MRQEPHVSDFLRFFVFDAESFADFCNVLFKFFHSIRIESMMFYIISDIIQATLRGLYSQRMYEILMIKQKKTRPDTRQKDGSMDGLIEVLRST